MTRARDRESFIAGIAKPVDLAVGTEGTLYVPARGDGSVYAIRFQP